MTLWVGTHLLQGSDEKCTEALRGLEVVQHLLELNCSGQ